MATDNLSALTGQPEITGTTDAAEQFEFANRPQCEPAGNPRILTPGHDPALGPADPMTTLVEQLGIVADSIRQLNTDYGLRPYRVFSVLYRWTGAERGRGNPELVREVEFLPTPKVEFIPLRREMKEAGQTDDGSFRLAQVSPRYTERELYDLAHQGPMTPDLEGFVEVTADARDGDSPRRRFRVGDVPSRRPDKFDWSVKLYVQQERRDLDGAYSHSKKFPK